MNDSTVLNFVLTDPKDGSFTEDFYIARNFTRDVKPIVLHEFNHFYTIYHAARDDFKFRVVVHAGLLDSGATPAGEHIVGEFHSKTEFKDVELVFITRKPDLFGEDIFSAVKDGRKYYNFKYLNREDFIKEFLIDVKVYQKGDLNLPTTSIGVESNISLHNKGAKSFEDVDFAVVTALYDDESTAFISNSHKVKDFEPNTSNELKLKFKEDDDKPAIDYRLPYLLVHSHTMGMVDATFNSAMILERYNPKYLIMGGVCGGKEGKKENDKQTQGLKYRDLIIANNIMDIQTGKIEKGLFIPYLLNEQANVELINFISQNKERIKDQMYLLANKSDTQFRDYVHNCVIRIGDYGCGSQVINTNEYFKNQISSRNNKAIAVEMESYGVFRSCTLHNTLKKKRSTLPLTVKSVMDYTDEHKTDEYKSDAAKMSYLCIRAMMPLLIDFHGKFSTQ